MTRTNLVRRHLLTTIGMTCLLYGTVCGAGTAPPQVEKAPLLLELIDEAGAEWQVPEGTTKLSVLAVGGGGGGAPGLGNAGGGGGGGGLVFVEDYLKKFEAAPGDVIEVKVGMPGPIVSMTQGRRGFSGTDTAFGKIKAIGGGGGGRGNNVDPVHHASSGGSAGGGSMGDKLPQALQPAESGVGTGFGHPGGGASEGGGAGGGGAGGPGTPEGKGGGGIGLQGIPLDVFIDKTTGFVTGKFVANNRAHYKFLFRDLFGPGIGEDGWFAGGGAHNASHHNDKAGKGGGSRWDAMPHTGGGGGGSTHEYQGGEPGIGGSGVVLIRCQNADGSVSVRGWGRAQPDEFVSKAMLREPSYLYRAGKYDAALAALAKQGPLDKVPAGARMNILRVYGQIYAAMGREDEALAKFKEANQLERK